MTITSTGTTSPSKLATASNWFHTCPAAMVASGIARPTVGTSFPHHQG